MSAARALGLVLALSGCGASRSGELAKLSAAAERAYSAGRYDEAASRWAEAAAGALRRDDRDEAEYRQAASLAHAGRSADAVTVLERLLRDSPHGLRAARAELDRARLQLSGGDGERAESSLDALVQAHPDSGLAPVALRLLFDRLRVRGEPAVRAYLDMRLPALENTELGQYLHAGYAASLERSGELARARERYLLVAERYPYPRGALWDDALFHAADLAARLGAPEDAIRYLERMLGERETAYVQGSYERGRYAEAQFRIAELYRDGLHDLGRARTAFERLWNAHRSSRLRDDAAWNAAKLAVALGDPEGACRNLGRLIAEAPSSRYRACAPLLCETIRPPRDAGPCHEYLVRNEGLGAPSPADPALR